MSYPSNDTTDPRWRTADLATSERHDLLSSERRRRALDALAGRSTTVDLETLATEVAARAAEAGAVGGESTDRVALTLHHAHLPRLDDAGVVDYDPERRRIDPDTLLVESLTTGNAHF